MYIFIPGYVYIMPKKARKNRREGGKMGPWSQNGPMLCAGYAPSMRLLCAKYKTQKMKRRWRDDWSSGGGIWMWGRGRRKKNMILLRASVKNQCLYRYVWGLWDDFSGRPHHFLFLLCAVRAKIEFVKDRSKTILLQFFVFTMRRARQN